MVAPGGHAGPRTRRGVLAVLCAVMAAPAIFFTAGAEPNAAADSTIAISGHGYGHGRGLSQWGSYGYATEYGWDYARILSHYYSNTTSGYIGDPWISVRLTALDNIAPVSYTHLTLPTTPYV